MTKEEFITLFTEELEVEEIQLTPDTNLETIDEWDSMGVMLLIALSQEHFNVKLTSNDLKNLTNIQSIMDKIGTEKFR